MREIKLSGKKYPICIDMNVLAVIQEQYGSILEFERKLHGLVPSKDGEGWVHGKEPSAKVIAHILPIMVNEALEVKADENNSPVKKISRIKIINDIDKSPAELVNIITEELAVCLSVKKKKMKNSGKKANRKKRRLTSTISGWFAERG